MGSPQRFQLATPHPCTAHADKPCPHPHYPISTWDKRGRRICTSCQSIGKEAETAVPTCTSKLRNMRSAWCWCLCPCSGINRGTLQPASLASACPTPRQGLAAASAAATLTAALLAPPATTCFWGPRTPAMPRSINPFRAAHPSCSARQAADVHYVAPSVWQLRLGALMLLLSLCCSAVRELREQVWRGLQRLHQEQVPWLPVSCRL